MPQRFGGNFTRNSGEIESRSGADVAMMRTHAIISPL
jgi:hypothetical protein